MGKYFVGNATGRQSTIDRIFLVSEGIYRMYQKTWQLDLRNFNFYGHPNVVFLSYQMQDLLIEISVFHKVYLGSKRPKEAVEFMRWHPIINQSMQEKEKKKQSLWFCC